MARLKVSPQANLDLESIAAYINRERPSASKRVGRKLLATFQLLARNPHIGDSCDHIRLGLRVFAPGRPASRYLVFFPYHLPENVVEIAAVIEGSRNWEAMLAPPSE